VSQLGDLYHARRPVLRKARKKLRSVLEAVATAIEDKALVRAEVRSLRIKQLASIERKADRKRWNPADALQRCGDLIGGRVVCNNIEDVYRFTELLKERLGGYLEWFEVQDQIKSPNATGYRALHVNLRLNVGEHPFTPDLIGCEIQIRTRLQDAWAELAHDDIYKQPTLPDGLRQRAKDLAELLAAADKIAADVRSQATREVVPPAQRPDLSRVSADGVAFVFKTTFGRSPPDYAVQSAINIAEKLSITSLESLAGLLGRTDYRDQLTKTYEGIVHIRPDNETVFLASLYAASKGDNGGLAYIRRQAQREWQEIDQIARREMLSSLPDTIEEFIEQLEDRQDEPDIAGWAEALGATDDCAICGTTIVHPDTFAEAVVHHYDVPESEADEVAQRLEGAIRNSGTETGGWDSSSLCAYHAERAQRDD
jgi:ppGpp synthetase/RelA/SpoT-type nucleotidyltranferase